MSDVIQNKISTHQTPAEPKTGELHHKLYQDSQLADVSEAIENQKTSTQQNHFLTGLLCLEPVSRACLSRLTQLWEAPPKADKPAPSKVPEKAEAAGLEALPQAFPFLSLEPNFGELLQQGLEGLFASDPLDAPEGPKTECEVKKDVDGNISVECTLPGDFK